MQKLFLLAFAISTLNAQSAPNTQDQILDQLKQLTKLFQEFIDLAKAPDPSGPKAAPIPERLSVDVKDLPSIGSDGAPLTLVEFTDFQCPFCAQFHKEVFPKIRDEYVSKGIVRFVHRDFPLKFHDHATIAAQAGRCAGDQKQFWQMREWLGSHPTELEPDKIVAEAAELHLDIEKFRWCLSTGKYKEAVELEAQDTETTLQLHGTPAFLLGKTADVVDGEVLMGMMPFAEFEKKFKELMK